MPAIGVCRTLDWHLPAIAGMARSCSSPGGSGLQDFFLPFSLRLSPIFRS
ncbi:hypothetical protein FHS09_002447 [Microbulbifer rhizosphaerae]|uniref:Uncharacterized protein n=1 Tax=Microbulbifer rhizosphaerae TaxID=1562603 RepID=A0A7W4WC86_9GAMM|nr:hypothetical protein [Microbulbifer rhizosphaerae]